MNSKSGTGIGRRQFIQVSSAVAAGAVLFGPKLVAAENAPVPTRLAVGFAEWVSNNEHPRLSLIPAESIWASDGTFLSHDARISMITARQASTEGTRRLATLDASFSYFEGAQQKIAPFYAWTDDRSSGRPRSGGSFNVPLDTQQSIRLTLGSGSTNAARSSKRRALGSGPSSSLRTLPFTLSLRDEPGTFRLARGFYVLVPLLDGEDAPTWSECRLSFMDTQLTLVDRNGEVAPFEYLAFRVTYAG